VTEIAAVLDRGRGLELAGLREFALDAPMCTILGGQIEERTLPRRHRPVGGPLTPAGDAREGILGRGAKGGARRW
jgi:hypothetical protein